MTVLKLEAMCQCDAIIGSAAVDARKLHVDLEADARRSTRK